MRSTGSSMSIILPWRGVVLAASAAMLLWAACGGAPQGMGAGEIVSTESGDARFRVETVATKLEVPWEVEFVPDGRIFITERSGRVRAIYRGALLPEPMITIEDVAIPGIALGIVSGEAGLMGMTLHPDFASNGYVYVAYVYRKDGDPFIRVARYHEESGKLVAPMTIIEGIEGASLHDGCRIGFGPDGKLYITTGDARTPELAQSLESVNGKTLRLNDDGSIPADNPFSTTPRARHEIWSLGHRNSQGLAWQPGSGLMFQSEHGPSGNDGPGGGDEINIVERGKNYGWPAIHHRMTREGMEVPVAEFTPAVAPAGCAFYNGDAFPALKGNLLVACLKGECLLRVVLDGRRVVRTERLLAGQYGRLRDVAIAPDGSIYIAVSNRDGRGDPADADDRILRLAPVR